jgi:hypothetical protein
VWINTNKMRSPEGADGGGASASAGAASPTPSSSGAASSGQQPGTPSASPQQHAAGGDRQADERARQQQAQHTQLWQKLNSQGVKSESDLLQRLEIASRFAPLATDPRASKVLEALAAPPAPDPATLPLTPATIAQVVDQRFAAHDRQVQERDARAQLERAIADEQRLVDQAFGDQRFAKLTGGKTFEQCRNGEAGVPALMAALLVDEMVFKATTRADGGRVPLTDANAMKSVADSVFKELSSFRAELLLAASGGQQANGTPAGIPAGAAVVGQPSGQSPQSEREARQRAAQDTFRKEFERMSGQGVVA